MPAPPRSPGGRFLAVSWAKKAVKLALLPASWLRRDRRPGLFVLIYHRVGAGMGQEMDVAEDLFRTQMRLLARRFEPVTLEEGAGRLASGDPLPRDLVAVTFDDGYRDVHRRAWPILSALRVPATLFLATAFLEGEIRAPIRRGRDAGEEPLPLAWDEVREMVASGLVSVGSHSHTHRDFDALTPGEAAEEVRRSKAILEDRLGRPVESFAYPRAVVGHEDVVAATYRYSVTGDGAKNPAGGTGSAPRRLSRTPIRASDGIVFFRARLAGADPLEDRLYARIRSGTRR
jgi:peptidoglycan/xylan/chitin deacetylase (PgdA/CDA1 family)